jgi:hypothetical protein
LRWPKVPAGRRGQQALEGRVRDFARAMGHEAKTDKTGTKGRLFLTDGREGCHRCIAEHQLFTGPLVDRGPDLHHRAG